MRENARVTNPYAPPDASSDGSNPSPDGPARPGVPQQVTPPSVTRPGPPHAGGTSELPSAPQGQRPVDEALAARAARQARLFGLLVLGSVLLSTLSLPWQAAMLPFALGGLFVGGRALLLALRSGARGGLPAALGLGMAVALMWSFVVGGMLMLWPVQMAHQQCTAEALTVTARSACDQKFEQDLKDWQTRLEDRATRA